MKPLRLPVALLVASLCLVSAASAQDPVLPVVPIDTALTIEWVNPEQTNMTFAAVVDGAIVKTFAAADLTVTPGEGGFVYSAEIPGIARGTHALLIRGHRTTAPSLGSTDSPALEFLAEMPPPASSAPRIKLTVATSGELLVELVGAADATGARAVSNTVLRLPSIQR